MGVRIPDNEYDHYVQGRIYKDGDDDEAGFFFAFRSSVSTVNINEDDLLAGLADVVTGSDATVYEVHRHTETVTDITP